VRRLTDAGEVLFEVATVEPNGPPDPDERQLPGASQLVDGRRSQLQKLADFGSREEA
jgi:hypothetical protein